MVRWLMMVLIAIGAVPAVSAPSIVPLAELERIAPGTSGYGLTALKGSAPTTFSFSIDGVVENFAGYDHVLMVHLRGEPFVSRRDGMLSGTGVLSGMSGSPMYLKDGRLIGALIMSMGGQRNAAIAFIGLAEDMLAMRKRVLPPEDAAPNAKVIPPGTSVASCSVWGDFQSCGVATVTFTDGVYLIFTGHESNSAPIGNVRGKLFLAPIIDIVSEFSADGSFKIPQRIGDPIGIVLYNGWNGQIARTDQTIEGVPVKLTVTGLGDTPLTRTCAIANSVASPIALAGEIKGYLQSLGVLNDEHASEVHLKMSDGSMSHFEGKPEAMIPWVARYLRAEFTKTPDGSPITSLDITVTSKTVSPPPEE